LALADSEAHFRALVEQAFNKDIPGDSDYEAITKTIITMCKNLNRTVVAEGVETAEQ
jgi:EAL domain-containing protein (putative c-di-GMP-specific phosphodiesterase class I)